MPMLDRTLNTVIMPFRLKFKRTGKYILSYKNSFLIRVQLLDNTAIECTLTVENTGSDCLNAVAQKLELRETKYFGLHYFNKQNKMRWVEPDKPLKKQIDKNANEPNLFFGVIYYVANIDSLEQEITRYLFYLQLKNNVIDGILHCNKAEAIELASYILQAEFGDHDSATHNVQYFRDYILFPESLTPDEENLDLLTLQAIEYQKRHRGLRPADSEYNFILKAIHLKGFSEELYTGKNTFGYDVTVGCSFAGIVIKSQPMKSQTASSSKLKSVSHEWSNVEHLSYNKQTLSIEIRREDASISFFQFIMDDIDTAKYLCRICDNQRKFYLQNQESTRKLPLEAASALIRRPTLRRNPELESEEIEQSVVSVQAGSDYSLAQDNKQVFNADRYYSSQTSLDHAYVSQTSLNHQPQAEQAARSRYSNGFGGSMYSSPSINSLVQSHVGRPSPATSNLSINSSHQRGINRVGLPHYRPSPDYEVALRQRRRYSSYLEGNNPGVMHHPANQQHPSTSVPQPSVKQRPHSMIYSQQELVHQAAHPPQLAHYPQHQQPVYYRRSHPPLNSSQGQIAQQMHWDTSHESLSPQGGSQVVDPRLVSLEGNDLRALAGSTPELTYQQQQGRPLFVSEIQLYRHYQNPPATQHGSASTSTPDLTRQNVSASSPDLHLGYNPSSRPHRPLPPVQAYVEDNYSNDQRLMVQLMNNQLPSSPEKIVMRGDHMTSSPENMLMRGEPNQHRPTSSNMEILDKRQSHHQTPQQNVQAYLNHVEQSQHQPVVKPYTRPLSGSREHLLKQEPSYDQIQYDNQPRPHQIRTGSNSNQVELMKPHNDNISYRQHHKKTPYHHATEPSTATVVVHSDDEGQVTSDYMLSQQLQDRGLEQVRISRSQEFLDSCQPLPRVDVSNNVTDSNQNVNMRNFIQTSGATGEQPESSSFRPPPPYPTDFVENSQTETDTNEEEVQISHLSIVSDPAPVNSRGPPPPYHTPSPSELGQVTETNDNEESEEVKSESFEHARRSTIRKMAPLKFAAMNGLNASQRSNSPVKGEPDERVLNLEAKVDEGHLLTEYDQLPRARTQDFELESFSSRDRIKEVLPYRDNRVLITPSSDNPTGYINASHIKAVVADEDWNYIACQTPLDGCEDEMWDMIWSNNVSIIVLIAQNAEHDKVRCATYWPDSLDGDDIPTALFGPYKVMSKFDSSASSGDEKCSRITRNLVLEKSGSSEKRIVWMLQYIGWPETGVPKETDEFLGFLEELASVRRLAGDAIENRSSNPVVVQCSSGSGRTGVLVLAELMIQCLERNQNIDVSVMLLHLRQQRMHFLQTFSQYNFVYKILISFLRKSRLI